MKKGTSPIIDNGATLDMNGFDNEVNTLSGNGTVENSASGTSVWLGVGVDDTPNETDHDTIFGGVLQDVGTGQLAPAKLGDDMLTLFGVNTYSGQTVVEDGTLYIASTGSIADSPVTLAGGQLSGANAPAATSVATTVTLVSDADPNNPPVYGQSVTFTATVSPTNSGYGTPTGTVDFYDEATETDLGLGTYADGVYTLETSALDAEDHYITATFTPDTNSIFLTSASDPLDQEVGPETTSTVVTVFDNTQNANNSSPTYSDQLTFTATVSPTISGVAIPAIDGEGNAETVDFQDQTTGQDLGTVALTANSDGTATAVFQTANLALGSHTIIAIYSGDDNFASSASTDPNGSSAPVTVVGQGLSFASPSGGGILSEGRTAGVSGTVSGLDGAAFSLNVVWGDGQSGDSDNGGQPFYYAAGTTSFTVNHYYNTVGSYTLDVTVTAGDGRQVEDNTSVSVTVSAVAIPVVLIEPPVPDGGYDLGTEYTFGAVGYSPDSGGLSYQWDVYDGSGNLTASYSGPSVQLTGAQIGNASVTVSGSGGAVTTVYLGDPANCDCIGISQSTPALPTVTITESDANQMVFEGDVATFDVHATWTAAPGVMVVPLIDMTGLFYSTIDASGAAPADYRTDPRSAAGGVWVHHLRQHHGDLRHGRDDHG